MKIEAMDPADPRVRVLLGQSDAYMSALYPPQSNHLEDVAALRLPNVYFVGASLDTVIAACGAVKTMDDDDKYGEIKRVFVASDYRGRGLSTAIMQVLERHLTDHGVPLARLETGVLQPEALGLYRRLGYVQRPPFGRYQPDPLSVFMEKRL
ncbi:MAG: GNAT family N-acetyltransferase [Steroidobacterales bacterium]